MQTNLITREEYLTGQKPKERSKAGWRAIGGSRIYFRSKWEYNYALYLNWLKTHGEVKIWQYEPTTFWFLEIKRGVRSYKPDFYVEYKDGVKEYIEIKGWMDPKSKTKIKRFQKYYPQHTLHIVGIEFFRTMTSKLRNQIEGWEL